MGFECRSSSALWRAGQGLMVAQEPLEDPGLATFEGPSVEDEEYSCPETRREN